MKINLVFACLLLQIAGYVSLFFHLWTGLILIACSYAGLFTILFLLAQERKKEEPFNDYRDY
ncbi:hypothetical protein QRD89_04435 [Halobacillus sp. ACCC02827]|uniref:hypothetical protein n=1 Tax=Bacillaceae TaxID=186817 RepID=UPI0002A4D403|nr:MULTISPECIES: hypothetical protein [Bacillaceae]ELK48858.1 hypothetical protein D479_01145 [Halobacillus sp. BAB-2008]QHT45812.1 hypothetical protein M662_04565 [Bacillus sp. SB49]WJE16614.1 hypothetical protein QRD89_04435 [Halobacillus sp. ACCC02827]